MNGIVLFAIYVHQVAVVNSYILKPPMRLHLSLINVEVIELQNKTHKLVGPSCRLLLVPLLILIRA